MLQNRIKSMKCVMQAVCRDENRISDFNDGNINRLRYSEGTSNGMKYLGRKWKMRCKAEICEEDCKWDE